MNAEDEAAKLHESDEEKQAAREEALRKVAKAIHLLRKQANWLAYEMATRESSAVNIHIRLSSAKNPSVNVTFEQFAFEEGDEFICLSKPSTPS